MKKIILIFAILMLGNQLMAQWKPTPAELKKFWADIEKQELDHYLKTHPITTDLSEAKCDSIFLVLINQYRKEKGLTAVKYNIALDSSCRLHTLFMLKYDTCGHVEPYLNVDGGYYPNPINRIKKYDAIWVKEHPYFLENCEFSGGTISSIPNDPYVKYKTITIESITDIINGWKNSPGHNAAMLDSKVRYIGFYTKSKYIKRKNHFYIASTLFLSN